MRGKWGRVLDRCCQLGGPIPRIVTHGAVTMVIALLIVLVPHDLTRMRESLAHPWVQLDNEEGALLAQALSLAHGHTIYRPLREYPFVAGTYPPFYLWLAGILTNASAPTFYAGRLLTAFAVLWICLVMFASVLVLTRHFRSALLAPLLFLVTFECYNWSGYFRVDMLAIALTFTGLALVLIAPNRPWSLISAACINAAALFTKQTVYSAPIAALIAFWFTDRRSFRLYGSTLAVSCAVPFLGLTALTRGQFPIHTIWYNMNRYHWPDIIVWAAHVWRFYRWWLLALMPASAMLVKWLLGRRFTWNSGDHPVSEKDRGDVPSEASTSALPQTQSFPLHNQIAPVRVATALLYFLCSLSNFMSLPKAGSAENYLLEPLAAGALVCALALGWSVSTQCTEPRLYGRAYTTLLALLLLLHAANVHRWHPVIFGVGKLPNAADFEIAARLTRELARAKGNVVSELSGYTIFANKPVLFQPFIMSELARQGRWDQSRFVTDMREGRFAVVAATVDLLSNAYTDAFTEEMRAALRSSYRMDQRFVGGRVWPTMYLYRPATSAASTSQFGSKIP